VFICSIIIILSCYVFVCVWDFLTKEKGSKLIRGCVRACVCVCVRVCLIVGGFIWVLVFLCACVRVVCARASVFMFIILFE